MLVSAAWAAKASACSLPPPGWFAQLATHHVPVDGVVLVEQRCHVACEAAPEPPGVSIRSGATGDELPGELEPVSALEGNRLLFAWRPAETLVEGSYEAFLSFGTSTAIQVLEVVAAADPERETITVATETSSFELAHGEPVCCPSGPVDSCQMPLCYTPFVRRSVTVSFELGGLEEPALATQHLHRILWEGVDEPTAWQLGQGSSHSFDEPRALYCYTVELKSVSDGEVRRLESACVAHPDGVELGVYERDPSEVASALGICEEPPAGQLAPWCEARRDRCAEFSHGSCAELERLCPELSGSEQSDEDGGCSFEGQAGGRGGPPASPLLVLLALGWARRRVTPRE